MIPFEKVISNKIQLIVSDGCPRDDYRNSLWSNVPEGVACSFVFTGLLINILINYLPIFF